MLHTVETKAPWCKQNKKNKSQCIECQINAWGCIASLTKYSFGLLVYLYLVLYWYHWYICKIENNILMLTLFVFRNHAVGLSSFFENIGGISAPFIVYAVSLLIRVTTLCINLFIETWCRCTPFDYLLKFNHYKLNQSRHP